MPGRVAAKLFVAPLLVAALSGCGDTRVVDGSRVVSLGLTEYRLVPQSIRAPSGQLTIFAHNYGRLMHNLAVLANGEGIATTDPIRPGQTAELIMTLSPGKYLMVSTLQSDRALGVYATLAVRP